MRKLSYIIIIIFGIIIDRVNSSCSTKICQDQYLKFGNENNRFFDASTFGGKIHPNPTQILKQTGNNHFRSFLNEIGQCHGLQCGANNLYNCLNRGNSYCYHVEHIYDKNGQDDRIPSNCNVCKNIPGNFIMAFGRWNMALGGLARKNYNAAQIEKTLIYGKHIMKQAFDNIMQCCSETTGYIGPKEFYYLEGHTDQLQNDTNYDIECDIDNMCTCDTDSNCGCDCDFDDASLKMLELSKLSADASIVTFVFTVLVIFILFIILICLCCISMKMSRRFKEVNRKFNELIDKKRIITPKLGQVASVAPPMAPMAPMATRHSISKFKSKSNKNNLERLLQDEEEYRMVNGLLDDQI